MPNDDVPKSVRVRTDPDDGLAYRFDTIQAAARFWDCNKSDAIVRSCDAVGELVPALEEALQHEDLPPRVAREIVESVNRECRTVSLDYRGPEVDVDDE